MSYFELPPGYSFQDGVLTRPEGEEIPTQTQEEQSPRSGDQECVSR